GTVGPGLRLGVLDAVVMGPSDPGKAAIAFASDPSSEQVTAAERMADRGLAYSAMRPLHLGLHDALPADRPTPKNYIAVVARKAFSPHPAGGAPVTAVDAPAPRCAPKAFATPAQYAAADCVGKGGRALGLDWNLRSENRDWVFLGMFDASRREGGPA